MHRWDCPTDYEARSKARRDADFDSSYGHRSYHTPFDDCDESNRRYRQEYDRQFSYQENRRQEEAAERRAAQHRREEREYWESQERQCYEEQQQQYDEEYAAAEAAYYADLWREQFVDEPRMADDGCPHI